MLPVVRGERTTAMQVLLYTLLLTAITLVPGLLGTFGPAYLVTAALLGAVFCALAWRLWRNRTAANAALTFHFSLLYLALLFVAVAVDAALR
jgi:protoheme IX farnesyltransferase